jgi:hypothetical protein
MTGLRRCCPVALLAAACSGFLGCCCCDGKKADTQTAGKMSDQADAQGQARSANDDASSIFRRARSPDRDVQGVGLSDTSKSIERDLGVVQ